MTATDPAVEGLYTALTEPEQHLYDALTDGLGELTGRLADPAVKRLASPEDQTIATVKAHVGALAAELAQPAVQEIAGITGHEERLARSVRAVREHRAAASTASGVRNVALRLLLDTGVKASHGAQLVLVNRTFVEREVKPHTTVEVKVDMPNPADVAQRAQAVVLYHDAVANGILKIRDQTARKMKAGDYGREYQPNEIGRIGGDELLGGDGSPIPSGQVAIILYGKTGKKGSRTPDAPA